LHVQLPDGANHRRQLLRQALELGRHSERDVDALLLQRAT
jgi:hypothetical protein